jgi:hypothetical protein
MLPGLAGAKRAARNIKCLSNLGQIARASHAYMADPPCVRPPIPDLLELGTEVWVCPAFKPLVLAHDASYTWVTLPWPGTASALAWTNRTEAANRGGEVLAYDASPLFHGHTNAAFLLGHAARDPNR